MVGPRQRLVSEDKFVTDPKCVNIAEALVQGDKFGGVNYTRSLKRALEEAKVTETDVNVRIGDQHITIDHSGCIPEHERTESTSRAVVTSCSLERCGGCVLKILGPSVHAGMVNGRERPILGSGRPVDIPVPFDNLHTS